MSQRELAEQAGITQVALTHIETGRTQPREATKRCLAWALGYEVKRLFPTKPRGRSTA